MPITPTYGLPYPQLSDPPNVPADLQALATAVESTITSTEQNVASLGTRVTTLENNTSYGPWQALTLLAGWVTRGGYHVPAARLAPGGRVELRGGLSGGTVTGGTVFATLAAEFRPAASVSFAISANDSGGGGLAGNPRVFVRTNGNMEIWGIAGTSPFHIDGCGFSL